MVLLITILLFQSLAANVAPPSEEELLARGLQLEQAGQYEQALEVWARGRTTLETPSLALGRAYIRLATQEQLDRHYQLGSIMYFWGYRPGRWMPTPRPLKKRWRCWPRWRALAGLVEPE